MQLFTKKDKQDRPMRYWKSSFYLKTGEILKNHFPWYPLTHYGIWFNNLPVEINGEVRVLNHNISK